MNTVRYARIAYQTADSPISGPISKFGGQPVWIGQPQWPLSRSLGKPMRFACQIAIEPALFGNTAGRMAYVFITDYAAEGEYVDGTWAADGGENAVIVQPGSTLVPVAPLFEGPTLRRLEPRRPGAPTLVSCEFGLVLHPGEEAAFDPQFAGLDEGDLSYLDQFLLADKIGGSPRFVQTPEEPATSGWRLLVQFGTTPCELPFGGGWAYAFLSPAGDSGKLVWQR